MVYARRVNLNRKNNAANAAGREYERAPLHHERGALLNRVTRDQLPGTT
jgi:hypothetical protein